MLGLAFKALPSQASVCSASSLVPGPEGTLSLDPTAVSVLQHSQKHLCSATTITGTSDVFFLNAPSHTHILQGLSPSQGMSRWPLVLMNGSTITHSNKATGPLNLPPPYQQALILRVAEERDWYGAGISYRTAPTMSQVFSRPHLPPSTCWSVPASVSYSDTTSWGAPSSRLQPGTSGYLPGKAMALLPSAPEPPPCHLHRHRH